ncbi:MAG: aspartate--tRNA ligase [Deltaproteobacteria bacterium]|nr:aspartate--tRNA ligase [Deltaproteobacteria bacterium]
MPSRVHQGRFYALPQSPQLFKQMLMMGGMDRYYQIARCFRDEDLRPNRQPEFTQLDLEASFIDESFIFDLIEELTCRMFRVGHIELLRPFSRMTYQEAVSRYGTDRPDTRFDMTFEDVTSVLQDTTYGIFRDIIGQGGLVKGFCVKGQGHALSKNVLQNEYAMKIVPSFGGSGMTWMKVVDGRLESNIVQFFSEAEQAGIMDAFNAGEGDVLLMIADTAHPLVHSVLCDLRLHVAERLHLIPEDTFNALWITDFPLFERKADGIHSLHHPFTMPDRTDFDPGKPDELLTLRSRAYDLVVNGEELGGGSIRIHTMDVQRKIFDALGLTPDEIESKFGFFLSAFEYGTPPHGGLALGLDRMIAMILKTPSIREVIAFPKNRRAWCPLTRAPSPASPHQLDELGLLKGSGRKGFTAGATPRTGDRRPIQKQQTITREEVRHVARLARLRISDTEAERLQQDLNAVLSHFETLQELNTRDVPPMSHVLDLKNVWREDQAHPSHMTEPILENAPDRDADYFKVPRILEG